MAFTKDDKKYLKELLIAERKHTDKKFDEMRSEYATNKKLDELRDEFIFEQSENTKEILSAIGYYEGVFAKKEDVKNLSVRVARLEEMTAK